MSWLNSVLNLFWLLREYWKRGGKEGDIFIIFYIDMIDHFKALSFGVEEACAGDDALWPTWTHFVLMNHESQRRFWLKFSFDEFVLSHSRPNPLKMLERHMACRLPSEAEN